MDFSPYDKRGYPVVSARQGYGEWAAHYEDTVAFGIDTLLLPQVTSVPWASVESAADLACGTGRTGAWLTQRGVRGLDGVDATPEMMAQAAAKGIYRSLRQGDVAATGLPSAVYELCTMSLADEHLAELRPVYREAARLLKPRGQFLLLGYHPFFVLNGIPTHYHRGGDGEAVTIETHLHLFSHHFAAGTQAGLTLVEFKEGVIDEAWLETKPKWRKHLGWPVSFVLVWTKA
jgi:SAM-dependent methyltransferase